jgi:hypothetical protein
MLRQSERTRFNANLNDEIDSLETRSAINTQSNQFHISQKYKECFICLVFIYNKSRLGEGDMWKLMHGFHFRLP